jgi:hypothetical protein
MFRKRGVMFKVRKIFCYLCGDEKLLVGTITSSGESVQQQPMDLSPALIPRPACATQIEIYPEMRE